MDFLLLTTTENKMQDKYNRRFLYLKDFETKEEIDYWSLPDLFQNVTNFYDNFSSDEFIRNLRLDEMKILINHKRFNPKDLGWFLLNICQMRGDLLVRKEVLNIAELKIKYPPTLN